MRKIYPRFVQDISKIYKDIPRYTKFQAVAGRPRRRLVLGISWYIFVYIWIHIEYTFGKIVNIFLEISWNFLKVSGMPADSTGLPKGKDGAAWKTHFSALAAALDAADGYKFRSFEANSRGSSGQIIAFIRVYSNL